VAAIAELTRRPMFLPHRDRDERDELRSAGAQVAAELRLAPSTVEDRALTAAPRRGVPGDAWRVAGGRDRPSPGRNDH
jgi:hypothetical protein